MNRQGKRRLLALVWTLWIGLLLGSAAAEVQRSFGLIAEGTAWENPYHVVDTGVEGPTLLLTAGLHGNEPAGYRAAEQIRHWPLRCGKLIVVPRTNTPGLEQNTRWLPGEPEELRNANRNFPKSDGPNEARGKLAVALWEFLGQRPPDWVVDLHEGVDFHVANPESVGSSIIYFDSPEMRKLADKIHRDVNATIDDPQREIVKLSKGPVDGGLVRAVIERLGAKGFCFETTFTKQPLSTRTRQHRIMVHCLLCELGMAEGCRDVMVARDDPATTCVAVYDGEGTGGNGVANLRKILRPEGEFTMRQVGVADIRPGVLEQFDVVIFPGGSGSKQAAALGPEGRRAVQQFVRRGGGYIGICAGAYLATAKYDWSLKLIDAKTFTGMRDVPGVGKKAMWFRGKGKVQMELTEQGQAILGDFSGPIEVGYANGPILSPAGQDGLDPYIPLAFFRTEISKYEPQEGTMVDTPALVAGRFGQGRVIAVSPHPEGTAGLEPLVRRAVAWVASGTPPLPLGEGQGEGDSARGVEMAGRL